MLPTWRSWKWSRARQHRLLTSLSLQDLPRTTPGERERCIRTPTTGPNCWDMVRATNRLITSPSPTPLTLPPPGFCNAVILPRLMICATPSEIWLFAKISPTTKKKCVSRALSRRGRRCSVFFFLNTAEENQIESKSPGLRKKKKTKEGGSAYKCHPSQLVTVVRMTSWIDGMGPSAPAGTRSNKDQAYERAAAHPNMEHHLRIKAA